MLQVKPPIFPSSVRQWSFHIIVQLVLVGISVYFIYKGQSPRFLFLALKVHISCKVVVHLNNKICKTPLAKQDRHFLIDKQVLLIHVARGDLVFNALPFVMHAKIKPYFILTLWTYEVLFFYQGEKKMKILWKCCRITVGTDKIKGFCTNCSSRGTIWCLNAESFKFYPVIVDLCSHVHDI